MTTLTSTFRLALIAGAALAMLPMTSSAQSLPSNLLVRVRAVDIQPANQDTIAITDVSVSKKMIPEVDFTWFFSPNIAAELILTYPQKHDVSSTAHGGQIGTLKHLPPTLTAQYHFTDFGPFKPYVGAGLNYTRFSAVELPAGFDVKRNSFGLALQVGADYQIDKNWSLNVDLKKVTIRTDLSSNGTNLGTIKVDPLLVGVGVGYRY